MLRGGIDENGLGGNIGPLVVTAVLSEDLKYVEDSKEFFKRERWQFARLEACALGALRQVKKDIKSFKDIFTLSLTNQKIETICPIKPDIICFRDIPLPVWADVEKISFYERSFDGLIYDIKFAILCPGLLHSEIRLYKNKFYVDALWMIVLGLSLSGNAEIICGKVGGIKKYGKIRIFEGKIFEIRKIREENRISEYVVKLGDVERRFCFLYDAEKFSSQVSLASIIGKYIRELSLLSLSGEEDYPLSSGYPHDPKNHILLERLKLMGEIGLPKECIIREKE